MAVSSKQWNIGVNEVICSLFTAKQNNVPSRIWVPYIAYHDFIVLEK